MSYTTTAITTYSGNNTVVVTTIANMLSGLPIVFTGNVFGNVVANATYYIGNITSVNQITITSLPGGAIYAVANGSGSMTATFSDSGQQIINTVPPGDPLDVAFNKTNINFDQVFAAGPVGSNVQIADNTIRTLNTNGNLVLAPNGIGNVVSNVNIVPNTANIRNLGSPTQRWNTVYTQYIDYIAGNITFTNLDITGNLEAGGFVSAGGNVIGDYFIGNGRQLTGISLSQISNGNSYANIPASNGNLVVGINSNVVATFSSAGLSVPGNVVAGNIVTNSVVGNIITISAVGGITLNTNTGNISAASQYINNILNPMQGQDAATKAYVDSVAVGLQVKEAVYLATTAALPACSYYNGPSDNGIGATLTADAVGNLTIDGVQVTTIDTRLLIQNQANAAFNGIYVVSQVPDDVTAFILTRSADFDIAADMYGAYVLSTDGDLNDGNGFVCTNSAVLTPITVGYTAINFTLFSSSLVYSAGNGISIVGSVISTRVNSANLDYVGGILQVSDSAIFTTPNIGSATGSTLSVTGNITGGNVSTAGNVTATKVVAVSVTGNTVTANTVNTVDLVSDTAVIGNITIAGNVIGSNLDNSNIVLQANGVGLVQIAGTGGLVLPVGTTGQEPLPATTATIRFNSDTANLEFYNGSVWVTLSPVFSVANQTINGNGVDDTFVLDQFATADTVLVTINGVTQTPDVDYTIVDPEIIFTTIPASGDVIQIRFLNGSLAGASGNTGGNINYIANGDSYANVVAPNGNLEISLNGVDWTFGTNGNLIIPGNINFGGDSSAAPNLNDFFSVTSAVDFSIVTDSANTGRTWNFGADGVLTLPNADATGFGNIYFEENSSTITFGLDDNSSGRTYSFAFTGMTLPRDAVGNTDPYLTIVGGANPGITSTDVSLAGPANLGIVSDYTIFSGFSGTEFFIHADDGELGGNGNVVLTTNNSNVGNTFSWTFGSNGNLTLPNGAAIRDTTGDAVAFGLNAGQNTQGIGAVAIGALAGQNTQGSQAVAIGETAGQSAQGIETVAIGYSAGFTNQGNSAVAIGSGAGATNQGHSAIAIGRLAGRTNQGNNSIILNATDADLDQTVANTFTVKPVRQANTANAMYYNASTGEITYATAGTLPLANGTSNFDIATANGNATITANTSSWTFANTGNLTLPGNTFAVNYANGTPVSISGGGSGSIIQSATAPADPTSSTLWWDEVSGTLYVWYDDGVCTQWVAAAPSAGISTGNVTFNNINVIGDGNLHLQPDPANAGSYLDIYLTAGPDLHLVASAAASLILGYDNGPNVKIGGADGNVTIQSWDVSNNTQGGVWTFGADGNLTTLGNVSLGGLLSAPQQTKLSNDPGTPGEICWDGNYIYVCVATDTWKQSPLNSY